MNNDQHNSTGGNVHDGNDRGNPVGTNQNAMGNPSQPGAQTTPPPGTAMPPQGTPVPPYGNPAAPYGAQPGVPVYPPVNRYAPPPSMGFPPDSPYYSYGGPSPQPKIRPALNCTAKDGVFALIVFVLGFMFINFIGVNLMTLGVGVPVFTVCLLVYTMLYFRASKIAFSVESGIYAVVIAFASTYYIFYSNAVLGALNLLFIILCYVYWIATVTKTRLKDTMGSFLIADLFNQLFTIPILNFVTAISAIKVSFTKSGRGKAILLSIAGILIALPVTIVIALLLTNADSAFANLYEKFTREFIERIGLYFWEFVFGIPVALYLFGLIFGGIKKRYTDIITADSVTASARKLRKVPAVMIYGALTTFVIIYTLFFLSQIQYLFSGFSANLPGGFTYSEYARRGFFDLCTVASINLIILFVVHCVTKRAENKSGKPMKAYTIVLSLYTIGLIAIALSKMFLYINVKGLTELRVYTSWFMVFLFIVFAAIIAKQFIRKINLARITTICGAVMILILCFANTDAIIARNNAGLCLNGEKLEDINHITTLSDSAVPYVEKIYLESKDEDTKKTARIALYIMSQRYRGKTWASFNLSVRQADGILNKYTERPEYMDEYNPYREEYPYGEYIEEAY